MGITRLIKLTCKLFVFGLLIVLGYELIERSRGSLELPFDPLDRADQLSAEKRHAEARLLANFVLEHPALGDPDRAKKIVQQESDTLDSVAGKLHRFARGAATGEPTDTASLLGSLSLDFFVIGDIRDLIVQGYREIAHEDGDRVIMALSAVGLATTLAPEIDWAPSMLKSFRRSGSLTREFSTNLLKLSEASVKSKNFSRLSGSVQDFAVTARKMGPAPLSQAMRSVNNVDDLSRLARASEIDFRGSYVLATGFKNAGVKRIASDGSNIGKLIGKIRRSSRGIKAFRKSVGIVPTIILVLVFSLALGLLLRSSLVRLISRPRRARVSLP